jgi:hypothetical protein
LYADKRATAPSVAEARRELGQQTIRGYAETWLPRQRRMTEYSTKENVLSSLNVHIIPALGSRKLNSVTPSVVEQFLDDLETRGVGRGNQVSIFRVLKPILLDAHEKGAIPGSPIKGVQARAVNVNNIWSITGLNGSSLERRGAYGSRGCGHAELSAF